MDTATEGRNDQDGFSLGVDGELGLANNWVLRQVVDGLSGWPGSQNVEVHEPVEPVFVELDEVMELIVEQELLNRMDAAVVVKGLEQQFVLGIPNSQHIAIFEFAVASEEYQELGLAELDGLPLIVQYFCLFQDFNADVDFCQSYYPYIGVLLDQKELLGELVKERIGDVLVLVRHAKLDFVLLLKGLGGCYHCVETNATVVNEQELFGTDADYGFDLIFEGFVDGFDLLNGDLFLFKVDLVELDDFS